MTWKRLILMIQLEKNTIKNEIEANDLEELGTAHVVPCLYCDGVFKSQPQGLHHAMKQHKEMVERDPNRRDGIKRRCPYCVMAFWRANRLIR